ncbi:hypothetical protein [Nocardia sp. NPDC057227]|uniref:hypothetical protein n=1 Tax=Nocardia sp. NPDC057227 TaxID=3346056 RepID=UPI003634AC6C
MATSSRVLRSAWGNSSAEAFLIVAIATILITRLYLELTGYPQVGGKSLHIAHALYGGAAMAVALLLGWLFLGSGVRGFAVLLGGIGFGLFLDEVGKFVTKDNDYFYGPAAEIMYISVVVLLVASRLTRELRTPTRDEYLGNAAAVAADGLVRGLPPHRRTAALLMLDSAAELGADPADVTGVRALLERAAHRDDRLRALRLRAAAFIPGWAGGPWPVWILGWLLVFSAFVTVGFGIAQLVTGGLQLQDRSYELELDRMTVSGGILFVSALVTLALALPAMLRARRDGPLWPLRLLRIAALVYTMLNALVDFATEGFGALTNVALGLLTMAFISRRIAVRYAELVGAADELGEPVRRAVDAPGRNPR